MKLKSKTLRQIQLRIVLFSLFQKNLNEKENIIADEKSADDTVNFKRIRCPQCRWQPRVSSRWFCTDAGFPEYFSGGCGTVWNTFQTGGVCPGCRYQWKWTACLRCGRSSPHKDWYEDDKD